MKIYLILPIISVVSVLAGCVTTPDKELSGYPETINEKNYTFNKKYDVVWDVLLANLVANDWKIIASSKEGGVISTDSSTITTRKPVYVWPHDNRSFKSTVKYYNGYKDDEEIRTGYVDGLEWRFQQYSKSEGQRIIDVNRREADRGTIPCFRSRVHDVRLSFIIKRISANKTSVTIKPVIKSLFHYKKLSNNPNVLHVKGAFRDDNRNRAWLRTDPCVNQRVKSRDFFNQLPKLFYGLE